MLEIEITDDFIFNLCLTTESDWEEMTLGEGSERVTFIHDDSLAVKLPLWGKVNEDIEQSPWNIKTLKNPKNTILTKNNKSFIFFHEEQSQIELEIVKFIPAKLLDKYSAKLVKYGVWRNRIIGFWERLTPAVGDYYYYSDKTEEEIFYDAKEMITEMSRELAEYPVYISDLHINNFGYNKSGQIKFLDLGFWKRKNISSFTVDFNSFSLGEWGCKGYYSTQGE